MTTDTRRDPELDRLAHGVLWPGFIGQTLPGWLGRELERGLGGVLYFAHNIDADDPDQTRLLSEAIHAVRPDAVIGADEEGGIVTRFQASAGSMFPGNAALGRIDDEAITEATAAEIGLLCASGGIDLDLAPTVDVNSNPLNPVIGVRSFGADAKTVSRHTAAFVRGLQSAGVAACAKHFPGHGDTVTDSHLAAAVSDLSLETLESIHLAPFRAAISAGVKAVMTAHITVPALGEAPATVNPRALGLARELGFTGVIVTDSLHMAAIRERMGVRAGAVAALQAGADLLCVGNPLGDEYTDEQNFADCLDAVYEALSTGALEVERVAASVQRNAELAAWRREAASALVRSGTAAGTTADASWMRGPWADTLVTAMEVVGDVRIPHGERIAVVDTRIRSQKAVDGRSDRFTTALRESGTLTGGVDTIAVGDAATADRAVEAARTHRGTVLILTDLPKSSAAETSFLHALLTARPDAIVIDSGWPAPGPTPARLIRTLGSSRPAARAVVRLLTGE